MHLLFFRDKGREGEREEEKHQCERETSVSCCLYAPPTGDQTLNPGMCSNWESNQRPFSLWNDAQPHLLGQENFLKVSKGNIHQLPEIAKIPQIIK